MLRTLQMTLVMVVLVHNFVQQTHLLVLHLETLGYIPRILNALNGLVYFLIIGDPRGDNLMVGSIFQKLLTELGLRTEDAECNLMGEICNFANLVLIIKVVWVSTISRQAIDTPVMPRSHIHGSDAGLATDTIRHHSWRTVLVCRFPCCIRIQT